MPLTRPSPDARQPMSQGRQRQRHGVAKNLAEGVGGLVVGAALVVLTRRLLRQHRGGAAATPQALPRAAEPPASSTPGSAPKPDPKDQTPIRESPA